MSDQTVGNILKGRGIEPAPDRKRQTTWKTFIQSHWEVLAAIDFTTIEVWTKGGLVTAVVRVSAGLGSQATAVRHSGFRLGCVEDARGRWLGAVFDRP